MFEFSHRTAAGAAFALVVAAVFAHIWFASAPLPFGGPNVWLAGAAGVAAALAGVLRLRRVKLAPRVALAGAGGTALAVVGVAALFLGWMVAVYLGTGTFNSAKVGKLAVGIALLVAILVSVDTVRRVKVLIGAIIAATAVSVLFGFAVLGVGEPFLSLWLHIANVAETDLLMVLVFGRSAGAAAHPSTLAYQLAAALPLAFAALVYGAFGRRRRLAADAALFVVLVALLAMVLVNGSRSTMFALGVGWAVCAAGIWFSPARRALARRFLVVTAAAAIVLVAVFAPLRAAERAVTEKNGDVEGIRPGVAEVETAPNMLGHVFEGFEPGKPHVLRIRERYKWRGWGESSGTTITADAQGRVGVSWFLPDRPDVNMWQVRIKAVGSRAEWPWRFFKPRLASPAMALGVRGLAVGYEPPPYGVFRRVGLPVTGLRPQRQYVLQLRANLANQIGAPAEVAGATDADGVLPISWELVQGLVVDYELRFRLADEAAFGIWHRCAPVLPRPPAWEGLMVGIDSLGADSAPGAHRLGHSFGGFRPWGWFAVQLRERLAPGVASAPRHGEVRAKPSTEGDFVITWPEPAAVEAVARYQFRWRGINSGDWSPWREFQATLTSRASRMPPVSAGGADDEHPGRVRHTIRGLVPAQEHRMQLRVRTEHGVGLPSEVVKGVARPDGRLTLGWAEPESITGYRIRLWKEAGRRWQPWRDLAHPIDGGTTSANPPAGQRTTARNLDLARNAQRSGGGLGEERKIEFTHPSVLSRKAQLTVALRYALDHPLGAGVYRPSLDHAPGDLLASIREDALRLWPHNQFLHVLALFGAPGAALHLLFYALLALAAWRACKAARRRRAPQLQFVTVAVVAAWLTYSANSLMLPTGPFIHDWGHYFVLGLLLILERLADRLPETEAERAPGRHSL